jgi:alpha-N-arabinofuranosidase
MNKIKIDKDRVLGKINNNVFGGLIEHAGKAVYGGIVHYNHSKADQDGFRSDVLDTFRELNTPILRWPGGNFASGYHWEDGVGPINLRPVRYDLEWQVEESNRFGTDGFLKLCRKIKVEPYICVNAGSGTAEEAAHWVEYCNLKGNSYYAKLREKNGNPDPYGVKYWGIGNELYGRGQIGRKDIGQYIDCVKEFSRLMKKVDPTIKLIVVGFEKTEWNFRLVKEAGEYFDYISVHSYHIGDIPKSYEEITAFSLLTGEQLYEMKCSIDAASYYIKDRRNKPIEIAFDEWNLREWKHEKFIEWLTLAYDYNTYNRELVSRNSTIVGKEGIKSREEMIDFVTKRRSEDNDNS